MAEDGQTSVASRARSNSDAQLGRGRLQRRRKRARIRVLVFCLAIVLLAGLAMLADGYYQAYRIYRDARSALSLVEQAKTSIAQGTMPAGEPLGRAASLAASASSELAHARFTLRLVGGLPVLGRPVQALRIGVAALSEDGQAAAIGQRLLDELLPGASSGTSSDPPSKIIQNGAVNIPLLDRAIPQVQRMVAHLRNGERLLQQIPSLPFVTKLKSTGLRESESALAQVEHALAGLRVFPSFLGGNRPKTYFLALQNSADQRGTGGAVLAYALVRIDNGRPSLISGGSIMNIDNAAHGEPVRFPAAVDWYLEAARVRPRINNGINYSPNFPVVASTWATQVHRVTGVKIDGVIGLTPGAIAAALRSVQPIRVPSYPGPIDGNNVAGIVESRQYSLPTAQQHALPAQLIGAAFRAITHPTSGLAMARELAIALAQKDLQVWSAGARLQRELVALGWDGGLRPYSGDYLYLVDEKRVTNKVDYFSRLAMLDTVVVGTSGSTTSTCQITLNNHTPLGQPRYVTGRLTPYGANVAMMNLYVPRGARLLSVVGANRWKGGLRPVAKLTHIRPVGFVQHVEGSHRVFTSTVAAWPGHPAALTYRYSVPGVILTSPKGLVYRLTLQHQPLAHPEQVTVRVILPSGARVGGLEPGWTVTGNVATFRTSLVRDLVTQIVFSAQG